MDNSTRDDSFGNLAFYEKAKNAFRNLFNFAKTKNELHFALSLQSEFRGMQDPGWNTATEARVVVADFCEFLKNAKDTAFNARVSLGFYSHLSEASGFYEVPKNMLRVAEGKRFSCWPFQHLVDKHRETGTIIAPNANKILRNLVGHAKILSFDDLVEVFRDAFDGDLRNGYAHADYVVWEDGIRLPKRNGGKRRVVSWTEFNARLERGINFFKLLCEIVDESKSSYNPAKIVKGQLADEPETAWTIFADPQTKKFRIAG